MILGADIEEGRDSVGGRDGLDLGLRYVEKSGEHLGLIVIMHKDGIRGTIFNCRESEGSRNGEDDLVFRDLSQFVDLFEALP